MKPGPLIDLTHPDEIEIRRLSASSKEESEEIRADLERRGFTVTVREMSGEHVPGLYHADIFAEKRTIPTEAELADRVASQAKEEKARRRGFRLLWVGFWVGLVLVAIIIGYLLGPLAWLIRQLF